MKVIGGSASQMLTNALVQLPGFEQTPVKIKRFPDTECYVKIRENLKGEDVVLVATTYPDEKIIETLLLQDAIRNSNSGKLYTVVPYFGYARQDKLFEEGEAVSSRNLAKHIGLLSDKVYTIDIHNVSIMDAFGTSAENLTGMKAIGEYLASNGVEAILSPDVGSKDRASVAAEAAGCSWDFLEKTRHSSTRVEIKPKHLDVDGKTVAIVDDIISTGGTIIKATDQLKDQGAKKIIAACTHGLFTGNAITKLSTACDMVFSTDTLESMASQISMASVLSKALTES